MSSFKRGADPTGIFVTFGLPIPDCWAADLNPNAPIKELRALRFLFWSKVARLIRSTKKVRRSVIRSQYVIIHEFVDVGLSFFLILGAIL
jgi:hypothetical protein